MTSVTPQPLQHLLHILPIPAPSKSASTTSTSALRSTRSHSFNSIKFDHTGRYILCAGSNRQPLLYNPLKAQLIQSYDPTQHGYEILDLAVSSDNQQFATAGRDRFVALWQVDNTETSAVQRVRGVGEQPIHTVAFNSNNNVLLAAGEDCMVRCFDLRQHTHTPVQQLTEATDTVTRIRVDELHNATRIYTASVDGIVRCYDLRTGQLTVDHVLSPISDLVLTADGLTFITASLDNTMRAFSTHTGELQHEYVGHQHNQYKLQCTVSHDDQLLYVGSEDSLIYAYSRHSKSREVAPVAQLEGTTASDAVINVVAHSPTASLLVSASTDGVVRVWD